MVQNIFKVKSYVPGVFSLGILIFAFHEKVNLQSAFDGDGFFKTGDLGYFDDDGYLFLKGRKSDLVITGGFNVYPAVVERVINEFRGVKESAVIGIPDPVKGEKVMAVIVSEAAGKVVIDELKKHCREKLVNYQCPVSFEIVEELPRNTMGKVLKRELKEKFKYRDGIHK